MPPIPLVKIVEILRNSTQGLTRSRGFAQPKELVEANRILQMVALNPILTFQPNGAQQKAIEVVGKNEHFIVVLSFANGVGKTADVMAILAAIFWGAPTCAFDYPLYHSVPVDWPKTFRIVTESELVDDSGPIQTEIKNWWPKGRYTQVKDRKSYNHFIATDTGWSGEVMTYEQATTAFEGKTKSINVFIEPPPRNIFYACLARQRKGGINILDMTPLYHAGWVKDEILDVKSVVVDGVEYGKSICLTADIEENCQEHGINGQLSHANIMQIVSRYDPDEMEARAHGRFMHLTGRVYKTFSRQSHVLETFPDYHQDCWDKGLFTLYNVIDPHDRKPAAIGWYAVFPNQDIFVIAEWPDYDFHKVKEGSLAVKVYAKIVRETEAPWGSVVEDRIQDPHFGNTMKDGRTPHQRFMDEGIYYRNGKGSINLGHSAVKELLGDPKLGIRPKLYFLSHCKNHIYGMEHYAYNENKDLSKGVSERPEYLNDDFPALLKYLALDGPTYREKLKPQIFWDSKRRRSASA